MNNLFNSVSVCQFGARRRYMIPEFLQEQGYLNTLYTDSFSQSKLARIANWLLKTGITHPSLTRLLNRNPKIPSDKIFASDKWEIKVLLSHYLCSKETFIDTSLQGGSKYFKRNKISGKWLYSMCVENLDFVEYAKNRGLKIITDIYENPYIYHELEQEYDLPELKAIQYQKINVIAAGKVRDLYVDRMLGLADQYIIPSEYVAKSLEISPNFKKEKVNLIPYPSSIKNFTYANHAIRGRIIWMGNDPIRKGLVYALRAYKMIKRDFPFAEFIVIGPMPRELMESKDFADVTFTGYLSKEQMIREFNQADMYVFPTLGEGFAGTILESASHGVPLITTYESGCDSHFPAMIVPKRNTQALYNAIALLLNNRCYRDELSHKAFQYSQNHRANFFESLTNILLTK